ncbi:MAG TPA: FMN-binding protein [Gammaproteobacteria bacterium]|nr:FMN-binding protein [Gammaproteobacteria bacterium]
MIPQLVSGSAEIYQPPDTFLAEVFPDGVPPARLLWLTGARKEAAARILGHAPPSLRVRYWMRGARSAWILEEIGKEHPITAGFVIEDGAVRRVRVLIYRESRGWEVRFPAFTDQFTGARLTAEHHLDRHIDNISGATLSVGAMKRMAALALYLASEIENNDDRAP